MGTAINTRPDMAQEARRAHHEASRKLLAASDASHPLRQAHGADTLASDARQEFRCMGQTLVPLLLDELDEARRLLSLRTPTQPAADESGIIHAWLTETAELRYVEVSRGRSARLMATLWQLNAHAEDRKIGHGEGATLSEAVQRAQGVIIL